MNGLGFRAHLNGPDWAENLTLCISKLATAASRNGSVRFQFLPVPPEGYVCISHCGHEPFYFIVDSIYNVRH